MKRTALFLLSCLTFFTLAGTPARQLEESLQKSSPGLPEFRVFTDMFGTVRTVRTLPSEKRGGVFKLSLIKQHLRMNLLEIAGVSEADLTGLADFKELKSLRISADTVKGLDSGAMPSVNRIDLSGTGITDVKWIANFPNVRILRLPESVTDITPLKGRTFRALSIPGVYDSDGVCRKLNITVAIRTGHAYRRPGRDRLPPTQVVKNSEGKATEVRFLRFNPPPRSFKGFTGEMFPEERALPGVRPAVTDYPGLNEFTRKTPLKASVFLKDASTLQVLDLQALRGVEFNGESFPELRELYLSGAVINLASLKAPKLKKLHLINVEGGRPGEVFEFSNNVPPYRQILPAREGVAKVAPGKNLTLDSLKISLKRLEFDFNSLKDIQFKELECFYDGADLSFLKGKKMTRLVLNAPNVTGKSTAVLGQLPLKELNIALGPNADYTFLGKMKLRTLIISGTGKSNFSVALLRKMPLQSLHLRNVFGGRTDLTALKAPQLQELVLDNITFTKAGFLSSFPKLRSLAIENCVFAPSGMSLRTPDIDYLCGDRLSKAVLGLKKLKNLRMGAICVFLPGDRLANYEFPWERFKVLPLENLSITAARADFCKEFTSLKRLKIDDFSKNGIDPLQVKVPKELDLLALTNVRPRPDRAVPEYRFLFRRPVMPSAKKEAGIARKVYLDGPGGFNGGFLR